MMNHFKMNMLILLRFESREISAVLKTAWKTLTLAPVGKAGQEVTDGVEFLYCMGVGWNCFIVWEWVGISLLYENGMEFLYCMRIGWNSFIV